MRSLDLLEKSRVTHQGPRERSFHIFYQLMKGAPAELKTELSLDLNMSDYLFIKNSKKDVDGVNDVEEFKSTLHAMEIMNFTKEDTHNFFRVLAAVLNLGNMEFKDARNDEAQLPDSACRFFAFGLRFHF